MDNSDVQLVGGPCGQHGPYTFYKAFKYNKNGIKRIVTLSEFFFVKLWSNSDLLCIGELQLLWCDKNSDQVLASLRLYFLPENTPEGRTDHGEDEVLAISEKVVLRVEDLITWITIDAEWTWGRLANCEQDIKDPPKNFCCGDDNKSFSLTDSSLDFSDVEKERNNSDCQLEQESPLVIILSYPRYCRYRAMMCRLDGVENDFLKYKIVNALGGFTAYTKNTRVLFCRETFDYPELEGHELLCNHLAPKLKGRPRGKRKKRSVSPGSESNESESSVSNIFATSKEKNLTQSSRNDIRCDNSTLRRSARSIENTESKEFLKELSGFMRTNYTPIGKIPSLGYKELDLHSFYTKVQKLGGYDSVTMNRLWKSIFDDMSGHASSTSAATVIRRHYERFLLPYERHMKGEEYKPLPISERRRLKSKTGSSTSDAETSESTSRSGNSTPIPLLNSTSPTTPSTPTENKEFNIVLKNEAKTSPLRSVRVKPERQSSKESNKSDSLPNNNNNNDEILCSSETIPTEDEPQIVNKIENSEPNLKTDNTSDVEYSPPTLFLLENRSTTPKSLLPKTELIPKTEKDVEPLTLAVVLKPETTPQHPVEGKENIPIIETGETPKSPDVIEVPYKPISPEIIDLDTYHTDIIKSTYLHEVKKRKLDILKEGGLEVTPVSPYIFSPVTTPPPITHQIKDSRPSVIQPTPIPKTLKNDLLHMPPPIVPALTKRLGLPLPSTLNVAKVRLDGSNISPKNFSGDNVHKIVQSRSIYSYSEKTVYGDPKNVMPMQSAPINVHAPKKPRHYGGDILDLTVTSPQKPMVEIMKLPQSQFGARSGPPPLSSSIIDSRRLGSNIEITLVEPPAPAMPPYYPPASATYHGNQLLERKSKRSASFFNQLTPPPHHAKSSRSMESSRKSNGRLMETPVLSNVYLQRSPALKTETTSIPVPPNQHFMMNMRPMPPPVPASPNPFLGHFLDPFYTAAVQSLYAHRGAGSGGGSSTATLPMAASPMMPMYPTGDQLKFYSDLMAHNSRMNIQFPIDGGGHHSGVNGGSYAKKL